MHIGISGSSSTSTTSPDTASASTSLPRGATAILDVLSNRSAPVEPEEEAEEDDGEPVGKPGRPAGLPSGGAGAAAAAVRVKVTSTYGGDAGARLRMVCRWAARLLDAAA